MRRMCIGTRYAICAMYEKERSIFTILYDIILNEDVGLYEATQIMANKQNENTGITWELRITNDGVIFKSI